MQLSRFRWLFWGPDGALGQKRQLIMAQELGAKTKKPPSASDCLVGTGIQSKGSPGEGVKQKARFFMKKGNCSQRRTIYERGEQKTRGRGPRQKGICSADEKPFKRDRGGKHWRR